MRKIKNKITPIRDLTPPLPPFHLMFPVHLNYKDRDIIKDCYFKDKIDLDKHLKRYKIKNFTVTVTQPRT
jgi:hypothetical protein